MSRTKILTTFGIGPAREALAISLPLMARYAQRHGYRLVVPSDAEVERACHGRPPSWGKIAWLDRVSRQPFDSTILWLDADVVVCRHDADIADVHSHSSAPPFVSMVIQNTPDGAVPSCGVMLINSTWRNGDCYEAIWNACGPDGMNAVRSASWWEQAAMIRWLGGDPDPSPIVTPPPSKKWGELAYEWNPHPFDPRGIPDDLRFFHATSTNDRLGDMLRWAARAETQ